MATSLVAQTTLRSILGQSDLDHVLTQRDAINQRLQEVIDSQTSTWGVKVTSVEVRDLELPPSMQRAMARQAEAEREKRAKVIHAEGEFSASQQLAAAAKVIGSQPATLQLRYLRCADRDRGREEQHDCVSPAARAVAGIPENSDSDERGSERKRAENSDRHVTRTHSRAPASDGRSHTVRLASLDIDDN